jgi:small subunit ribosomal protein S9
VIVKDSEVKEAVKAPTAKKKDEYIYAVGKRKTAVAQVRVYKKGEGKFIVNDKESVVYFPTPGLQERVTAAQKQAGQTDKLDVTVKVRGGGPVSQAEAVRHGIARALLELNANFRKPLKKAGYLTRDARKKERKKPGLKRARKAPQWKKR